MRTRTRLAARASAASLLAAVLGGASLLGTDDASAKRHHRLAKVRYATRPLRPHARGTDVRVLQRNLTRLKQRTAADGAFGKATYKSVRRFERRRHWHVDGWAGRKELRAIGYLVGQQQARKRAKRLAAAGAYRFPVGDPHDFGGPQSRFGAERSGHTHQGQDIFAPCRTRIYAAQGGRVKVSSYQAGGAGYYLVIDGDDGTDTVYMHMRKRSWAPVGTALYAGEQVGRVGQSGNASGCHLHFEHWTAPGWYAGGNPYDPLPELLSWDRYS